ncbi:MAG: alpha/beta fold hydrolase [Nanoarchaeota archaeon]
MENNFIIIHGVYSNPNSNWFPWLKKELESRGFEVLAPAFSTPLNQNLGSWLRTISKYEDKINERTVVIGHSLGAAFILDYLEKTSKKIKAAFLVAGFFQLLNSPYDSINKSFVDKKFDWEEIKRNCGKFFVFGSDNDEYISLDITKELAKNLNAELKIIHNGWHLNKEAGFTNFPMLLDLILALGVEAELSTGVA